MVALGKCHGERGQGAGPLVEDVRGAGWLRDGDGTHVTVLLLGDFSFGKHCQPRRDFRT